MSWDAGAISDWLLNQGRFAPNLEAVVAGLCNQLTDSGAPVWRFRLSFRTLHPLLAASSYIWERGDGMIEYFAAPHGLEQTEGYVDSPLHVIHVSRQPYRRRLMDGVSDDDPPVLHEFRDRGATDYFGLPLLVRDGHVGIAVFITDQATGFTDDDIAGMNHLCAVLGLLVQMHKAGDIAAAVAEAYLGKQTGARVLSGQITRGDIETARAAILISDLRGWTALNAAQPADRVVDIANRHFDMLGAAIEANGGEILKFMGDGLLAMFPLRAEGEAESHACKRALAAAQSARTNPVNNEPDMPDFGVGLHFGEVLYGNIGARTRLDFTVLGSAVNMAARIEALCKELDQPILASATFAKLTQLPDKPVATRHLKGLEGEQPIYAPAT